MKREISLAGTALAVLVFSSAAGAFVAHRQFAGDETALASTSATAKSVDKAGNTEKLASETVQDMNRLLFDTNYYLSGEAVDDFVKGDMIGSLYRGFELHWQAFTKPGGWYDTFSNDLGKVRDDIRASNVPNKAKYEQDINDMQALLDIAKEHNGPLGAQCLIYFQQAAEDINYALTGKGTRNGISEVQGSQIIHLFIKPYLE